MHGARILVLEDDPLWQATITDVLGAPADHIACAANVGQARDLLENRYFNVAIVDLSLRQADEKDSQGLEFLRLLGSLELRDTVRCVILSAYGSIARVRDAFHDFQVIDFLEKRSFDPQALIAAVARAMQSNALDHPLKVEFAGGGNLATLLNRFHWAQREDPFQLEPELYDLLRRLFPGCDGLFIQDLPAGQSGAGVLQVHPYNGANALMPVIVKFGKKDKIRCEQQNYREAIEPYAGAFSSIRLNATLGRVIGAISYQLIGTELQDVTSFADYYAERSADEVCQALDNLFRDTCGRWYENREQPKRQRDLVQLYVDGLHIKWDEVWAGAAASGINVGGERIEFPGLGGSYPNPLLWLEDGAHPMYCSTWRAVTHGDLNEHNILVTADGRCWLIDFYRSGLGHILRDTIEMETAVKFNLAAATSMSDHRRLEKQLLQQTSLDGPIALTGSREQRKTLQVIGHLRGLASTILGINNSMAEYQMGLLLTTINLLRLEFMQAEYPRVLLSAAMLCQQLAA